MNSTRHSFTLIELLVVIVLISMLVGITVPVYTRVMTGNAVSYGMRQVVSQLNMARVEACRSRRPVAVIFLIERGDAVNDVDDRSGIYNRRAFRSCYVDDSGSFEEWIPGTRWETLPKGAFFVVSQVATAGIGGFNGTGAIGNVTDDTNGAGGTSTADRLFPPASVGNPAVTLANAIVFDQTGRPASVAHVVVAQGTVNANTPTTASAAPLDPTEDNLANVATAQRADNIYKPNLHNWARCTVNAYTGRVTTEMND